MFNTESVDFPLNQGKPAKLSLVLRGTSSDTEYDHDELLLHSMFEVLRLFLENVVFKALDISNPSEMKGKLDALVDSVDSDYDSEDERIDACNELDQLYDMLELYMWYTTKYQDDMNSIDSTEAFKAHTAECKRRMYRLVHLSEFMYVSD